jgi:hypothetical protein
LGNVEQFYHPAAKDYEKRQVQYGQRIRQLQDWHNALVLHWEQITLAMSMQRKNDWCDTWLPLPGRSKYYMVSD